MSSILKRKTDKILQIYDKLEDIPQSQCLRCSTFIFAVLLVDEETTAKRIETIPDLSTFSHTFKKGINLISKHFPEIYASFNLVKERLDISIQGTFIAEHFSALEEETDHKDNLLSWFYQYCKNKHCLKNGEKIEGTDILSVTQFFTDRYMVKRIVTDALERITIHDIEKLRVLDPACGGGNFLVYAFEYLNKKFSSQKENLSEFLIENVLFGYDIDLELSGIAKVNLFIAYWKTNPKKESVSFNLFGDSSDIKGFFKFHSGKQQLFRSEFVAFKPWSTDKVNLNRIIDEKSIKVFITNPPFLGRRDMDIGLKDFLANLYPECKSDLCNSFLKHCLVNMGQSDVFGVVTQTSWLYLDSFSEFRRFILNNYLIEKCYDLGSEAFYDISGEKTNVALIIFSRKKAAYSLFYYLKDSSYSEKKELIETGNIPQELIFSTDQKQFLQNENCEIWYFLSGRLEEVYTNCPKYEKFAIPMQGTSTGSNESFVKYSWEKPTDPNWVLASKGGGYCKWLGLNIYKVNWGKNGSLVKENPGSALRNVAFMKDTQLVYSDTGTIGISVRLLLPQQVFIASGPGIRVTKGDAYAHMGFLNSKFSTFFLKVFSPKLTLSAGYIKKLPVTETILQSKIIASSARQCVTLKEKELKKIVTNQEFTNTDPSLIHDLRAFLLHCIKERLSNELDRLTFEEIIEQEISKCYLLTSEELNEVYKLVGSPVSNYPVKKFQIPIDKIDKELSDCLDVNTAFFKRSVDKGKTGIEGPLEYLARTYQIHPKCILISLLDNLSDLRLVQRVFLADLLHKSVLYYTGFVSNSNMAIKPISLESLSKQITNNWPEVDETIVELFGANQSLMKWLTQNLITHHQLSFYNKPILGIRENSVGAEK